MDASLPEPSDPRPPRRRALLTGGVAAGAALAGAGVAWWRWTSQAGMEPEPISPEFWSLSFDTPSGGSLSMATLRGRHVLLNFWATWCPPCIEELPLLDAFQQEHAPKNWQVVGLAIDQPSAVTRFLARTPVRFPIGMAGLSGTDLARSLGNVGGGLPFTVVLGPDGRIRQRRMGKLSAADLAGWAAAA